MSPSLILVGALLLGETSAAAPGLAGAQSHLVAGTATIKRGRARRARTVATERALEDAVWQRASSLVAKARRSEALRRQLGRKVRELIARFRTRQVRREGAQLTVLLSVTVDEVALKRRLGALGVPVLAPGVLLLASCDDGPLGQPVAAALAAAGIRTVPGPWLPLAVPAQVAAVRARPGVAVGRARTAGVRVAVVASCHPEPPRTPAPGATGVRLRVLVTLHATSSAIPTLWRTESSAVALGADREAAARAALGRAVARLLPTLERGLPRHLPAGPGRTLRLQVLGALSLPAALALADRVGREVPGVEAVLPVRLARGETWFLVRTVLDLAGLRHALGRLAPPAGVQLATQIVQPGGHLALSARLVEEQP
jgi:hypothetical protein